MCVGSYQRWLLSWSVRTWHGGSFATLMATRMACIRYSHFAAGGLFHLVALTPHGLQIRLCLRGRWHVVTIDDTLPVDPRSGMLVFSQCRDRQLWVPLLEKALAKVRGGYMKTIGGSVSVALSMLTGAPTLSVDLDTSYTSDDSEFYVSDGVPDDAHELLWGKLLAWEAAGFLMGASCGMV